MSEVSIQYILDAANVELSDMLSTEDIYTILDLCNRNKDLRNFKFRSCPLRIVSDELRDNYSKDDVVVFINKILDLLSYSPKITTPEVVKNNAYTTLDRDDFIDVFKSVFSKTVRSEPYFIQELCESNIFVGDFHLFHDEDEYYILHMKSGILINWYKHLGRANSINVKGFKLEDFRGILLMLEYDIMNYSTDAILK